MNNTESDIYKDIDILQRSIFVDYLKKAHISRFYASQFAFKELTQIFIHSKRNSIEDYEMLISLLRFSPYGEKGIMIYCETVKKEAAYIRKWKTDKLEFLTDICGVEPYEQHKTKVYREFLDDMGALYDREIKRIRAYKNAVNPFEKVIQCIYEYKNTADIITEYDDYMGAGVDEIRQAYNTLKDYKVITQEDDIKVVIWAYIQGVKDERTRRRLDELHGSGTH